MHIDLNVDGDVLALVVGLIIIISVILPFLNFNSWVATSLPARSHSYPLESWMVTTDTWRVPAGPPPLLR
jgi:hypothetical protein